MDIRLTVDDRRLVARLDQVNDAVRERLVGAMSRVQARLESAVRIAAPAKTGALKSDVGGRVYQDNPHRIAGYVGIYPAGADGARKAAALEYGSRGVAVAVLAHTTRITHAFGRAISPVSATRRGHVRIPTIQPHNFLRGPFAAQRGAILAELQAALDRAVQDNL